MNNAPDSPTDGAGVAPSINPNPGQLAALYRDWVEVCSAAEQAGRLAMPVSLVLDGDHDFVAHVGSRRGGGHLHVHPSLATEPGPARRWVLAHELGHLIAGHARWYAVFSILRMFGKVFLLAGVVLAAIAITRDDPVPGSVWLCLGSAAFTILSSGRQLRVYERAADQAAASIGYPLHPTLADSFARDDDPITRITNHAPWSTHPPWTKRHTNNDDPSTKES